ncbi:MULTISPECIES: hypothetical protein [unclassified Dehalobacter]|uniref:hypothetical protein n=1 Tax=unclassified Dehalobacter TaxID=2635733 RepID=UPI00104D53FD|nr:MULTISPECIES: hypothetical protein [unclassified Dehalobacter]
MSREYHINRQRGNLLPRAAGTDKPMPCLKYKFDVERYNQTGEVIPLSEPEEYKPLAWVIPDSWRNYPNQEMEGEDMPKNPLKPTKEELEKDRMTMTNGQIAQKYGAKTSTVYAWVKEYGLQRKKWENTRNNNPPESEAEQQPDEPDIGNVIVWIENADEPMDSVEIPIPDENELWQGVEENLRIIRQLKMASVDSEIRQRIDMILGG